MTIVEYEPGSGTWMTCLMLSLVGCLCGCCLIPFCVDSLKDAIHICPNCNAEVGKSEYIYKGGGSNYTPR